MGRERGAEGGSQGHARHALTTPRVGASARRTLYFEMQEDYKVPADDVVQYQYFYIPTNFKEPKWMQAIEVRPGQSQRRASRPGQIQGEAGYSAHTGR